MHEPVIREPKKPSRRVRYLVRHVDSDPRFFDFVNSIQHIAIDFLATPTMLEDAAALLAHRMRRRDYTRQQEAGFKRQKRNED